MKVNVGEIISSLLKGLDDYMILDEQTFKIRTDKGTLLVWILNSCWFWIMMKKLGIAQKKGSKKEKTILIHIVWREKWKEL